MTIVYIVETDFQCEFLTTGEQARPHQELLFDGIPNDFGVVKSFSQIALCAIIH